MSLGHDLLIPSKPLLDLIYHIYGLTPDEMCEQNKTCGFSFRFYVSRNPNEYRLVRFEMSLNQLAVKKNV